MSVVKHIKGLIPSMSDEQYAVGLKAEEWIKDNLPAIKCCTQHTLHDGIYSRTVFLPAGSVVVGVIIKVPTTIAMHGKMAFYIGDEVKYIDGYHVVTAEGGRKQIVYAFEDSHVTLTFKTDAKTIEEAENQMTDEADRLMSRQPESFNLVTITGE